MHEVDIILKSVHNELQVEFPESEVPMNSLRDTSFDQRTERLPSKFFSFSANCQRITTKSKDILFVLPHNLHSIFCRSIDFKVSHRSNAISTQVVPRSGIELPLDVGTYYHELFCLKREYSLSNLPSVQAIRVITTAKGEKARVAEIILFTPTGDAYLLELWNDDAVEGVQFLWEKLGSEAEVLFRIIDLDPQEPIKDKRLPVYKLCNPTPYQKEHKMFPIVHRIMVKNGSKDQYNDLRRQFRKINMNNQIQLMNGNDVIRDISLWCSLNLVNPLLL